MRILIAGGNGQIASRLERLLIDSGHDVTGIILNAEESDDLREAGVKPIVLDLESATLDEVAAAADGMDAVVFAAGAGAGSSIQSKQAVDHAAAVLLADAAEAKGVRRYLLVSSITADVNHSGDSGFDAYARAKGAAEDEISQRSGLDWVILRPGALTNDPGVKSVEISPARIVPFDEAKHLAPVSRDDVAALMAELLEIPGASGVKLNLLGGTVPIHEAAQAALGMR